MYKPIKIFIIILSVSIISCNRTPDYQGFSKTSSGIYFKLLSFGESNREIKPGNYITADISYATMKDSTFFDGRRTLQISEPKYKGSIDECFLMLSKDEKATFIIPANDFFKRTLETNLPDFISIQDSIKITIDVINVQNKSEFLKQNEAFLNWIRDFGDYEQVLLKQFIEEKKINAEPTKSGLYHIVIEEGNDVEVEKGDTVVVHYEGKFLNGKFFDSTKQRKQPFEFVYGHKMQVIDGMEEVIGKMKEGERALAILPSDIAFGKTGSSTGIIPPYTYVIYEVVLTDVRKNKDEKNN